MLEKNDIKKEVQSILERQERLEGAIITWTRRLEDLKHQVQEDKDRYHKLQENEGLLSSRIENILSYQDEHSKWLDALQLGVENLGKTDQVFFSKNEEQDQNVQEITKWLAALQLGIEDLRKAEQSLLLKNNEQDRNVQDITKWVADVQEHVDSFHPIHTDLLKQIELLKNDLKEISGWLSSLQKGEDRLEKNSIEQSKRSTLHEKELQKQTEWLLGLQHSIDVVKEDCNKIITIESLQKQTLKEYEHWLKSLEKNYSNVLGLLKNRTNKDQEYEKTLIDHNVWLEAHEAGVQYAYKTIKEIQGQVETLGKFLKEQEKWVGSIQRNVDQMHKQNEETQLLSGITRKYMISELRQKKKMIIVGTAEHNNIGDAAITLASQRFLAEWKPEYYQVEFSTYRIKEEFDYLCAIVNPEDLFIIQGGGNLGSLYIEEEAVHRLIISFFPDHKIIILPQTIYFESNNSGKQEEAASSEIYNSHPDISIFVRGANSMHVAERAFPSAKKYLMPDLVSTLHYPFHFERNGLLMVLRKDLEGAIDETEKAQLLMIGKKYFEEVDCLTNTTDFPITFDIRERVVRQELQKYAKKRLVITDRLHGMLFSVASRTPCILLDDKYGKNRDYYDTFLKDTGNAITLTDCEGEAIERAIQWFLQTPDVTFPDSDNLIETYFGKYL